MSLSCQCFCFILAEEKSEKRAASSLAHTAKAVRPETCRAIRGNGSMKQPLRETGQNLIQRSKGMLAGLKQKGSALFVVSSVQEENLEQMERLNKGRQRLAETPFGRRLLRWSQPKA